MKEEASHLYQGLSRPSVIKSKKWELYFEVTQSPSAWCNARHGEIECGERTTVRQNSQMP